MSSMVERLAEKQAKNFDVPCDENRERDARWWLNAIADELDKTLTTPERPNLGLTSTSDAVLKWLRSQASEGSDEDG